MKRRKALKYLGAGISAGLILPTWLSSCKDDEPKPAVNYKGKIAIIGAGAAGLYAAHYLISKGLSVTVFEASNRVGGRIRSLRTLDQSNEGLIIPTSIKLTADFPVELGADRIYGSDSFWAQFVKTRNVANVALSPADNDRYILNGAVTNHAAIAGDADFVAAQTFYQNLKTYSGSAVSVEQAIQNAGVNSDFQAILNGWIGATYGTDNAQLDAFGLGDALQHRVRNENDLVLPDNPMTDVLASIFVKGVKATKLNTVISQINYSGEKIVISGTQNGEAFSTEVDKVIITVPVSVLKAGNITFNPALPAEKAAALSKIGMDPMIRVILDFRRNFWQDNAADPELRFLYGGSTAAQYFNSGIDRGENRKCLSATIIGEKAEELSDLGEDMIPELLDELDVAFDGKATQEIRKNEGGKHVVAIQDWSKEPYIKGGVSYLKAGGTNSDREKLAMPVADKLFFAGEATDTTGEFASVNGALISAERAAIELIEAVAAQA